MRILNFKIHYTIIASFLLSNVAYSQNTNMGFAPQVGVYQAQKPVYVAPPMIKQPVVNYNNPQINRNLYNEVNGFKTPNRYALQSSYQNSNQAQTEDGYGIEYYLSASYGMGTFTGEGPTNPEKYSDPPINNEPQSLGDPSSISLGFGVMADRKFRAEIVYTALTGLSYGNTAVAYNQFCGVPSPGGTFAYDCTEELEVTDGGDIETTAIMLNFSLPLPDLLEDIFGDFLIPYVGGGFGIAYNKIDDFEVLDPYLYGESSYPDPNDGSQTIPGIVYYDGIVKHFGTTTNGLAWNVEIGATVNLSKKTMLDLYYKMSDFGNIETKSELYAVYGEYYILPPDSSNNCAAGYFLGESGWCESLDEGEISEYKDGFTETGSITTTEIGAKLRMLF